MNENPPGDGLVSADIFLSPAARQHLGQTRPWARFLSILFFIGSGFAMLMGSAFIILGAARRFLPAGEGNLEAIAGTVGSVAIGLLYIALGFINIPLGVFLSRYASSIRFLEANPSSQALEDALKQQKFFWRYTGVLAIIGLILGVIAVMLGVIFSVLLMQR